MADVKNKTQGLVEEPLAPEFKRYPLNVLLVAPYYDYGRPERGYSSEYFHLYLTFKELFINANFFDYYSILIKEGKDTMNKTVLEKIKKEKPDFVVFSIFNDNDFIPEIVEELKNYTTTLCYFWDDIWRVDFSEFWIQYFNYFTTASKNRVLRYKELSYNNFIYSPYGYNHFICNNKKNLKKKYDVSFVGGSHPYRKWIINQLKKANINVFVWGSGLWPRGRLSYDEMIKVFNQSKINLNLSNSVNWHLPYLMSSFRAIQNLLRSSKKKEQLKARMFEICGSGSFQLSYYAEGLEHCFKIGDEICIYMDIDDLIYKIRYYLKYEDIRENIAAEGYKRALSEHTYVNRFSKIIDHIFGSN